MFKKDNIYQTKITEVIDFSFDEKVAAVFPDMVHRSIPGYTSLLCIIQAIAKASLPIQPVIYDLGCSVGGVSLSIANILENNCQIIAVDLSKEMLAQFHNVIKNQPSEQCIQMIEDDIQTTDLKACDFICLNFTLQFLAPNHRQQMLNRCYQALKPNGILIIAEKTRESSDIIAWHEQFKLNNGYSSLEVAKKRTAIENIMQIDNEETILKRCQKAGFKEYQQVFHALSFKAWALTK